MLLQCLIGIHCLGAMSVIPKTADWFWVLADQFSFNTRPTHFEADNTNNYFLVFK